MFNAHRMMENFSIVRIIMIVYNKVYSFEGHQICWICCIICAHLKKEFTEESVQIQKLASLISFKRKKIFLYYLILIIHN